MQGKSGYDASSHHNRDKNFVHDSFVSSSSGHGMPQSSMGMSMKEREAMYSGELESHKDVAQSSYNVLAPMSGMPAVNLQDYQHHYKM